MAYWNDIANAAKTALETITGWPPTVVRMDGTVHPRDEASFPLCVVSFGSDDIDPAIGTTFAGDGDKASSVGKVYGLVIAIYRANLGDIETNLAANPDLVLAGKQKLNAIGLPGMGSVWHVRLLESAAWERQPFGQASEQSQFGIAYHATEPRNG